MNYAECLRFLEVLGHELRGAKFGLDAITRVLASLGNPQDAYPTAIVAGTNGKGSTSAMLASILTCAGYRTGLYSSPHLIRVNERIRIDGSEIPDEDFARAFSEVHSAIERLLTRGALEGQPSFFEYLTATAFLHFAHASIDFAVLEVGMGGRLDATNVTTPRVAVITPIDLDHQEFLGNTPAAIAREKAGVIKPRAAVVAACAHPEAAEVIRQRCAELGAELIETTQFAQLARVRHTGGQYVFDLRLNGDGFSELTSPLRGKFQMENAVTAATAAWRLAQGGLNVPRAAIVEGLRKVAWPGRLEGVSARPLVLLDGAHNAAGARAVAAFVREHLAGRRLRLVYASMRDKAIGEITETLFPLAEEVYLTRPAQARAAAPEEILAATRTRHTQVFFEPDPPRALERAYASSSPEEVILAIGSLFLVGEIKKAMAEGRVKIGSLSY